MGAERDVGVQEEPCSACLPPAPLRNIVSFNGWVAEHGGK